MIKRAIDEFCKKTERKQPEVRRFIGANVFSDKPVINQQVTVSNLYTGKKKTMELEEIKLFCEMLEITPNKLFGYDDFGNKAQSMLNEIADVFKRNS